MRVIPTISHPAEAVAKAYTSNHHRLDDPALGFAHITFMHVVDSVGVIHAEGIRIRSILLPLQTLVLSEDWLQKDGKTER